MNSRAPVIWTKFCIEGDGLDPDEFTRLVGIQPREEGRAICKPFGASKLNTTRIAWTKTSKPARSDLAAPRKNVRICQKSILPNSRDHTTIYMDEDQSIYDISLDSIEKLAELGCRFIA